MIPGQRHSTSGPGAGPWPDGAWQREVKASITSAAELRRRLHLDDAKLPFGDAGFPVRVPLPFVARMRCGDPNDPLLRQVLPDPAETDAKPGFVADALLESEAVIGPGVMQKYAGRALLLATGACAVNCRYCFRRHFPYAEHRQPYAEHRQSSRFPALAAVRQDPSLAEVILSGGDPLLLNDRHLAALVAEIASIPHVQRLRIHTRTPVVIPQRVTAALLDTFAGSRLRVVIVFHFNHPREIDDDCRRALAALAGFPLLNQSVLLAGVNDDADTLAALSEQLFDAGVLPYYLHMPDRVAGTAHFHVDEPRATAIHRALAAKLSGYLVPRLVRETPGAAAKELVCATKSRHGE